MRSGLASSQALVALMLANCMTRLAGITRPGLLAQMEATIDDCSRSGGGVAPQRCSEMEG